MHLVTEINENNLEEKIIKIFTFEGFIYHRINWILRERKEIYTKLNLFLILLIGSIMRKGEISTKSLIKEKNLYINNEKNSKRFLKFYKGSFLNDKAIGYYIELLSKKSKNIKL
jgi:hypothetical protein